uniref:Uncharacterized protein n=1 Tax=Oryza rufipogon TaxID=4529 RepID=A0A0E0NPE0_ORYRU
MGGLSRGGNVDIAYSPPMDMDARKALEEITRNHIRRVWWANSMEGVMGKRGTRGRYQEKKEIATFTRTIGVVGTPTTFHSSFHLDRDGAKSDHAYEGITNHFPCSEDDGFPRGSVVVLAVRGEAELRRHHEGDEVKRREERGSR